LAFRWVGSSWVLTLPVRYTGGGRLSIEYSDFDFFRGTINRPRRPNGRTSERRPHARLLPRLNRAASAGVAARRAVGYQDRRPSSNRAAPGSAPANDKHTMFINCRIRARGPTLYPPSAASLRQMRVLLLLLPCRQTVIVCRCQGNGEACGPMLGPVRLQLLSLPKREGNGSN
jgi:hypothetical protein